MHDILEYMKQCYLSSQGYLLLDSLWLLRFENYIEATPDYFLDEDYGVESAGTPTVLGAKGCSQY